MKNFQFGIVICMSWLLHTVAFAGWTSGGGHLPSDTDNPWFVKNTTQVSYSIEMDEVNFGTSLEIVRAKIATALDFWKKEVANLRDKRLIGSQQFVETACHDDVDIKFQMGILTAKQIAELQFPSRVVGTVFRNSYDLKHLKAKGVVYIAPQRGPLALSGASCGEWPLRPDYWQYAGGKALEMAIAHELGHVFGFPHVAAGTVMHEEFPSCVVAKIGSWIDTGSKIPPVAVVADFFARLTHSYSAEVDKVAMKAFGFSDTDGANRATISRGSGMFSVDQVYPGGYRESVGTFEVSGWNFDYIKIPIYLTPKQIVFSEVKVPPYGKVIWTHAETKAFALVKFKRKSDGKSVPVVLRVEPVTMSIIGTDDSDFAAIHFRADR